MTVMASARFLAPPGGNTWHVQVRDGVRLRVGVWRPIDTPRATVVLLGGRTEFIEKYHEVIGDLLTRQFVVWTCDWCGQGLSARALSNRHRGHIDDYETFIGDLRQLLATTVPADCPAARIVLAHSMGGHIALRLAAEDPACANGLVLSAPMIDISMPRLTRLTARWIAGGGVRLGVGHRYASEGDYGEKQAQFDGNELTHDRRRFDHAVAWIESTPDLALGGPTLGWLAASLRSIDRLRQRGYPERIRVPVLISSASEDTVVSNRAQYDLGERIPHGRLFVVNGSRHEALMEADDMRQQFWAAFDTFVGEVLP